MERVFHVHFVRPESFYGKIPVHSNWDSLDEDAQTEYLDKFFQLNQDIRAVEVDEFDTYER